MQGHRKGSNHFTSKIVNLAPRAKYQSFPSVETTLVPLQELLSAVSDDCKVFDELSEQHDSLERIKRSKFRSVSLLTSRVALLLLRSTHHNTRQVHGSLRA